ncbi:phosphotransferase enzyme family protein [Fredinandcohnia sp. 179-A 10B2 NHS]|uniref:phosphotransferase enzyme family protein n=1 Tax=Fredinandcohnia sp. 179-A 10B2 NHS TaxID=3235176 RepID=UPI0039A2F3E7
MLKEIEEIFNDKIVEHFSKCYQFKKEKLLYIGGFDSFVYEYNDDYKSYILKITHSIRRKLSEMLCEIDWIKHISSNGVAISEVIKSKHGNTVEKFGNENSYFLAVVYEKAPGVTANQDNWNKELFEEWGRVTGKIHFHTKTYQPKNIEWKRKMWFEEDYINIEKYIPSRETGVISRAKVLIKKINDIPRTNDNYGVIHGDLHYLNFNLSNNKITLFDCDDISYNYFINDLAVILFYAYWKPLNEFEDSDRFIEEFLSAFLKGYEKENTFKYEWFNTIHDFLMLRHIIQYIAFIQSVNISCMSDAEMNYKKIMQKIIEENLPIIDYDFTSFRLI